MRRPALRRPVLRALTGLVLGTALMLGAATPAVASPARFNVAHVHAGGAGATAARITGNFTWYNWSVGLENMNLYIAPQHCVSVIIQGYKGILHLAGYGTGQICSGSTARNIPLANQVLDPAPDPVAIEWILINVDDRTHAGGSKGEYDR